jgi:hypothetical protein
MPPLEDPLAKLLLRLDPDVARQWRGASAAQIEAIERIAGRPLPAFYRWFLERMGEDMGSMAYDLVDFSAETILSVYDSGDITPDGRHLLIGYNLDEVMPAHIFYNLDRPARDDCMVGQTEIDEFGLQPTFETFREMLGWAKFTNRLVCRLPQVCTGVVSVSDGPVRPHVAAVMTELGFADLLPSGPFCALYERGDIAMSFSGSPDKAPRLWVFDLGGPNEGDLRRVLGSLAVATSLEVKITEWKPPIETVS